ncbi:ankyrin repeat domain-containing protein [Lysobacter soli]|uniref:ankyrin repeat domain-containing protein n=1 Tax=Lysobacter soli TaxID=453783 RepID=UPI0020A11F3E|nr:ankyrin repeat domain-containing protein [Lysobacter soli]UTA52869.1 ankyrin repeat domain-containing protein [Lysobacter soli]
MRATTTIDELLQSTSSTLFPADMGRRRIAIDSRDCDGDTPLHVLIWRRNSGGARALIEAGADPNAIGDMGETPLHVAVRVGLPDVVEALLVAGAGTDVRSEFDVTPRDMAMAMGGDVARIFRTPRAAWSRSSY